MLLTHENVAKNQLSRLVLVEEPVGEELTFEVKSSSIVTSDGPSVSVTVYKDGDEFEYPEFANFVRDQFKPILASHDDLVGIQCDVTIITNDNYIITSNGIVVRNIRFLLRKDGETVTVIASPEATGQTAMQAGLLAQPTYVIPAQLVWALHTQDAKAVNKIRKRLKKTLSTHGNFNFKPTFTVRLLDYREEGDHDVKWTL